MAQCSVGMDSGGTLAGLVGHEHDVGASMSRKVLTTHGDRAQAAGLEGGNRASNREARRGSGPGGVLRFKRGDLTGALVASTEPSACLGSGTRG
jgi:hypothetical protein